MDNVEGMKLLPDNFIDFTVTSPPYSDLRRYNGFKWDFFETSEQLYRITKKGGVVVWVVADKTKNGSESGDSFRQALHFKELGFNLHDTMIYRRWSGPLTHNRYEQEFEYMFVLSKGKPTTFNPIMVDCKQGGTIWKRKNSDPYFSGDELGRRFRNRRNPFIIKSKRIDGNVWTMLNSSQRREAYGHPAPFPEELANRHIVSWSNPYDLVFDPFVGSGTTAAVAKRLGRNFLGFDVCQDYIDTALRRIENVQDSNVEPEEA
jgi:site-specific DNA-methyltransferase (adenine-specific)